MDDVMGGRGIMAVCKGASAPRCSLKTPIGPPVKEDGIVLRRVDFKNKMDWGESLNLL